MKKKKSEKNEINFNDWEVVQNDEEDKTKNGGKTIFDEFLLEEEDWGKTENLYKKKILKKKWIKENKYLDTKKFLSNISSFHYYDSHNSNLEIKFKEKNYQSIYASKIFFPIH